MTVIDVQKSPEHRTMTMTAEFDAPVDRVWEMLEQSTQTRAVVGPAHLSGDVHAARSVDRRTVSAHFD